jgi:hypothetical protein
LEVPGLGTVHLDFAEGMAYSLLLRFKLHDTGTDVGLYRAIENFLQPGGVLWDVGAFAGYVSAHFADPKFQLASIETFEPNPASLAHLRKFFAASSLVKLRPFAHRGRGHHHGALRRREQRVQPQAVALPLQKWRQARFPGQRLTRAQNNIVGRRLLTPFYVSFQLL